METKVHHSSTSKATSITLQTKGVGYITIDILPISKDSTISEKEKQIIHIAVLNFISLISALVSQQGAVSNPLSETDKDNIGYEVFLQSSDKEDEKEFIRRTTNQIDMFLKMTGVPYSVEITN